MTKPSRAAPDALPLLTEKVFQGMVQEMAGRFGWTFQYHTFNSQRSEEGFPDLVLVNQRQARILYAECKALKKNRTPKKASPEQQDWLDALEYCGAEVRVWTELDWPEIEATLKGE
mgnify:FL=1